MYTVRDGRPAALALQGGTVCGQEHTATCSELCDLRDSPYTESKEPWPRKTVLTVTKGIPGRGEADRVFLTPVWHGPLHGILEVVAAETSSAHPLLLVGEDCRPQEVAEIIIPGLDSFISKGYMRSTTKRARTQLDYTMNRATSVDTAWKNVQNKTKRNLHNTTGGIGSFVARLTVDQPLPSRHAVMRLFRSNSTHSARVSVFEVGRRSTTPAGPADTGR